MVLDIPAADFFGIAGHDGSQIAFPTLPDPMARRGLHIQECINACLTLGYAATPVELFPVIRATPPSTEEIVVLFGDDEAANWQRYEYTIQNSAGVLEGTGRRCHHAVAYDHGTIFDPDGDQYSYSRAACQSRHFIARCAWRVDLMQEEHLNTFNIRTTQ